MKSVEEVTACVEYSMTKPVHKHRTPWNKLVDSEKVRKACAVCNKVMLLTPHWAKRRKLCSRRCRAKSRIGFRHSAETIRKIRESNLGLKRSDDTRRRVADAVRRNPTRYWRGKHRSDVAGEKQWNWKGGVTPLNVRIRGCLEYRQWRNAVFERDDYTCQVCFKRGGGKLNADHHPITFAEIIRNGGITSLEDALRYALLWEPDNGRTLCESCHRRHHTTT